MALVKQCAETGLIAVCADGLPRVCGPACNVCDDLHKGTPKRWVVTIAGVKNCGISPGFGEPEGVLLDEYIGTPNGTWILDQLVTGERSGQKYCRWSLKQSADSRFIQRWYKTADCIIKKERRGAIPTGDVDHDDVFYWDVAVELTERDGKRTIAMFLQGQVFGQGRCEDELDFDGSFEVPAGECVRSFGGSGDGACEYDCGCQEDCGGCELEGAGLLAKFMTYNLAFTATPEY